MKRTNNVVSEHMGNKTKLLEEQLRFRVFGCSFKYPFETSMLTNEKPLDDRLEQMEELLHEMMKVENTAAGKISHKTPKIDLNLKKTHTQIGVSKKHKYFSQKIMFRK